MSLLDDYDPDAAPISGQPGNVPSPCIGICQMDAQQGLCTGCYRTIDEIISWGNASDASKRAIWRQIRLRMFASAASAD